MRDRIRCGKYPCGRRATRAMSIEHEGGEVEYLDRCEEHAYAIERDAIGRSTVVSVKVEAQ